MSDWTQLFTGLHEGLPMMLELRKIQLAEKQAKEAAARQAAQDARAGATQSAADQEKLDRLKAMGLDLSGSTPQAAGFAPPTQEANMQAPSAPDMSNVLPISMADLLNTTPGGMGPSQIAPFQPSGATPDYAPPPTGPVQPQMATPAQVGLPQTTAPTAPSAPIPPVSMLQLKPEVIQYIQTMGMDADTSLWFIDQLGQDAFVQQAGADPFATWAKYNPALTELEQGGLTPEEVSQYVMPAYNQMGADEKQTALGVFGDRIFGETGQPATLPEFNQTDYALGRDVLGRAESDPEFEQLYNQLMGDPRFKEEIGYLPGSFDLMTTPEAFSPPSPVNTTSPYFWGPNGEMVPNPAYESETGYDYPASGAGQGAERIDSVIDSYINTNYELGAGHGDVTDTQNADCSALPEQIYNAMGLDIGLVTTNRVYTSNDFSKVNVADLQPGDLILWDSLGKPRNGSWHGHMGVVTGRGTVVSIDSSDTNGPEAGGHWHERSLEEANALYPVMGFYRPTKLVSGAGDQTNIFDIPEDFYQSQLDELAPVKMTPNVVTGAMEPDPDGARQPIRGTMTDVNNEIKRRWDAQNAGGDQTGGGQQTPSLEKDVAGAFIDSALKMYRDGGIPLDVLKFQIQGWIDASGLALTVEDILAAEGITG